MKSKGFKISENGNQITLTDHKEREEKAMKYRRFVTAFVAGLALLNLMAGTALACHIFGHVRSGCGIPGGGGPACGGKGVCAMSEGSGAAPAVQQRGQAIGTRPNDAWQPRPTTPVPIEVRPIQGQGLKEKQSEKLQRKQMQVLQLPDLIIENISERLLPGKRFVIEVTIKNVGQAFSMYAPLGLWIPAIKFHQYVPLAGLDPGKSTTYPFGPFPDGIYKVTAVADPSNIVTESREDNNTLSKTIVVIRPEPMPSPPVKKGPPIEPIPAPKP